tara:strand:- start:5318 stop:7147 length:1830 start_codon:yes stop_codon:yes gene_type:complete
MNIQNITKNKLQIILIILVLFFSFTFLIFETILSPEASCKNFLPESISQLNTEDMLNQNKEFFRNGTAYLPLDLSTDVNSFKCIGQKYADNSLNNKNDIFFTSTKLYELIIFFTNYFLYILFDNYKKKSNVLFFSTTFIVFSCLSLIFFNKIIFDYILISFVPINFIYHFYKTSFDDYNTKLKIFRRFNIFFLSLLVFNYNLFAYFVFVYFLIYFYFFSDIKTSKAENNIFIYFPIYFYFLRQLSSISESFNFLWLRISGSMYKSISRFVDLEYALQVINCNFNNCEITNNYGPLWEILSINVNVKFYTIFIGIVTILAFQLFYFYNSRDKNIVYYFFLFVSPPIVFAFERLNIDLIISIMIFVALISIEKNKILSYIVISIASLIKIYPIFIFIGIIVYSMKNRNIKEVYFSTFFFIINVSIFLYYFFKFNFISRIQDQSGISWSYGVMSDASNINNYLNLNNQLLVYVSIMLFCILSQIYLFRRQDRYLSYGSKHSLYVFAFLITFLGTALFSAIDFRLILLVIPAFYIIQEDDFVYLKLTIFCFLLTSVSRYFNGFENIFSNLFDFLFSFVPIFLNYLSFYFLINYFSQTILRFLLSNYKNSFKNF